MAELKIEKASLVGNSMGGWVAAMTAAFDAWRRERGRSKVEPTKGLPAE